MKKISLVFVWLFSASAFAQLHPVNDSIPMRDGEKLAMTLYQPAGCSSCPTILIQTPYNRLLYNLGGLPLDIGYNIDDFDYNVVVMDWRGFWGSSAAAYAGSPTQGEDGYDAVEWIATQSWSNGKVGTWGPSALGRVQYNTAKENPPHLVCMAPLVAGPQYNYNEYYPGGVLRTEYVEQLSNLGFGTTPIIVANPVHNIVWNFTENQNFYPDSIRVPTFMIGGWYDHTIENMLEFFNAIRATSTGVQNDHRLLMGPWVHGGHGMVTLGSAAQGQLFYNNAANWNDSLALKFFDYHLRNISNGWNTTPVVQYYQMGQNTWENTSVWPPSGMNNIDLYLHSDGTLTSQAPTATTGSLNIVYDPLDPSPTVGGATLRNDLDQGPYDQVPVVESRTDLLTFTSPVLGQNVVMKGKAVAHLRISSDKRDTDFAIRLTDVYPDGRSMLLNDGIKRMRFREGYNAADTASMVPGTLYDCEIELPSTCITFLAGHRIRVDISSSNYPKYNRNDNSGGIMYPGNSTDSLANPQTALNTVYVNSTNASYITLPLIDFVGSTGEEIVGTCTANVFPNPAGETVSLQVGLDKPEQLHISFTDISGKIVLTENKIFNNGVSIYVFPTGHLQDGLYLVKIRGEKGETVKRLVIQH